MLNPLDMCEVTRGHGADLTEKDEGRESQFLSFIFFLVEKPDVPAVQPATQSRRERHHQQNTNDQNGDTEFGARTKNQEPESRIRLLKAKTTSLPSVP